MPHTTTAKGAFIVRRPATFGWLYYTGHRVRASLGVAAFVQLPEWSTDRDRARRYETRRAARRWLFREGGLSSSWGVEIVRIGTPPWVPLTRASVPRDRQLTMF